jgi:hypothetical protein
VQLSKIPGWKELDSVCAARLYRSIYAGRAHSFGVRLCIVQQFVIEREIPGAGQMSETQIRDLTLRSLEKLKLMGPRIQWLHSYVTEDKVYCVYLAPDEETIREHARSVGIPANRISAVRHLIDPTLQN